MNYILASALLVTAIAVPVAAQRGNGGATAAAAASAPQLKFRVDEEFFKLPPNIWPSEAVGVALNSKGHIFLLNRGNHPLLEFAADGSFVQSLGSVAVCKLLEFAALMLLVAASFVGPFHDTASRFVTAWWKLPDRAAIAASGRRTIRLR